MKLLLTILLILLFVISVCFASSYNGWDVRFRINGSYTRVALHNEDINSSYADVYGNNEVTSWLVSSKFVVQKDFTKTNLRNTITTKYGETNKAKTTDEIIIESLYRFRFKHIDSYSSAELFTVFKDFGEPNIWKLAVGGSKTFINNSSMTLESRIGSYFKKRYNPPLSTESGIEFITEFQKSLFNFNRIESKAEVYSEYEDLHHIYLKWDNSFISKISDAFGIEFEWLFYYETDPSNTPQKNMYRYNRVGYKQITAISLVYEFK